jgi:hypothetical protein
VITTVLGVWHNLPQLQRGGTDRWDSGLKEKSIQAICSCSQLDKGIGQATASLVEKSTFEDISKCGREG